MQGCVRQLGNYLKENGKKRKRGATKLVMDLHVISVCMGTMQHIQNQELYFCGVHLHFIIFLHSASTIKTTQMIQTQCIFVL